MLSSLTDLLTNAMLPTPSAQPSQSGDVSAHHECGRPPETIAANGRFCIRFCRSQLGFSFTPRNDDLAPRHQCQAERFDWSAGVTPGGKHRLIDQPSQLRQRKQLSDWSCSLTGAHQGLPDWTRSDMMYDFMRNA
ncbi:hypothetical protein BN1723_010064 [Verticillium longisporum]|uniref:Uncharacterized protein n=1 Tax=Verticillium longisporum TaxID=100787 RepID=A0A0G4KUP3_VERLO|nr:hypothetical protein BN1723_010064 [Verticillium longisporum]